MAGYPYGGNPQYPSPQNHIYPQLYNPANAPSPPMPGHPPSIPFPNMAGQNPQFPYYQPSYPQNNTPGQAGIPPFPSQIQPSHVNPAAMSYSGVAIAPTPTAPPSYGFGPPTVNALPTVSPLSNVEWVSTTPDQAHVLEERAIVAGYEGHDGSPLWVIRARFEGDLIPGKLAIKHRAAYVAWGGNENAVRHIEVCCAPPESVRWVQSRDGQVPPAAITGGGTEDGEVLYIGRSHHEKSLTPGKVQPSHNGMYISYAGKELPFKTYEVLCAV